MSRLPLFALLFVACTDEAKDDSPVDTTPEAPTPPEPAAYSGGECPELVDGRNDGFLSAGIERSFLLFLPPEPQGAPVVTAWHWLGGTAAEMAQVMRLRGWAEATGNIVVVPDSCCGTFEWPFIENEDATADETLFDDLVSCLHGQFDADLNRIHATGMSAGGLWTSHLIQHRGGVLASAAPLSGGTEGAMVFDAPERPIPVLLTWGGENDEAVGLDFNQANIAFSQQLRDSGSWVGECVHSRGHTIPSQSGDYLARFFADHTWDEAAPPYAEGFPTGDDFPEWCRVATEDGGGEG